MGVSGGSLSNIVLTLYGKPIHNAVATSAGLGVPITIVGTLGYILAGLPHQALLPPLSLGFVSLIGVAVMAPVSSLAAPYGARLAHRLSRRTLELAFSSFSVAGVGAVSGQLVLERLEHDPEKWVPVFGKDRARAKSYSHGYPLSTSRSPLTCQLCSRLRKLMPSKLVLS